VVSQVQRFLVAPLHLLTLPQIVVEVEPTRLESLADKMVLRV
jgi:hypothetical protein